MKHRDTFVGLAGTYNVPGSTLRPVVGRASLIYRAVTERGQAVCVKVYTDADALPGPISVNSSRTPASNFDHELRAYGQLEHPNILAVLDYGRDPESDALFLVLPWCEGGDLRQLMGQRQFFPLADALTILRNVALALDYAHARGYIHGDIKPENVVFASDLTRPFLTDFGSARRAAFVERVRTDERMDVGPGSTSYLSPEQINGESTTVSSDIYAFGTVAYEMLTTRLPVAANTPVFKQMMAKVTGDLAHASAANPRLPKHAADALMLSLSVDPSHRPATATLVCQMLAGETLAPAQRNKKRETTPARALTPRERFALWSVIITTLGTIAVAAVNVIPDLLKEKAETIATDSAKGRD